MKAYVEFIKTIEENPYHPVPTDDYPKLFDFEITREGVTYYARLKKEWSDGDLTERESMYLGMLHLAYAVYNKSPKECKDWQAYMFLIGKRMDTDDDTKTTLLQMGCIVNNSKYDPKLLKSHLIWKGKNMGTMDAEI